MKKTNAGQQTENLRFEILPISATRISYLLRAVVSAILLIAFLGCEKTDLNELPKQEVREFSKLTKTAESPDEFIQKELARLDGERESLQALLDQQVLASSGNNLVPKLEEVFPSEEKASKVLERYQDSWPVHLNEFEDVMFEKTLATYQAYLAEHTKIKEILKNPDGAFVIDYAKGLGAEVEFTDVLQIHAYAECFLGCQKVRLEKLDEAAHHLFELRGIAEKLSSCKHVVTRMAAVRIRRLMYELLSVIVTHPKSDRVLYQLLEENLRVALANWTSDSACLVGDRVIGMHSYEMVRNGYFLSLLTDAEYTRLKLVMRDQALAIVVAKNVDSDEKFYLETMRKFINLFNRPYYERTSDIEAIFADLESRRELPRFPTVAGNILLDGYVEHNKQLGRDKATAQAWLVGLQSALDLPITETVNDWTGQPFQPEKINGEVTVKGAETSISLPIRL